jgi:hypothetical protein
LAPGCGGSATSDAAHVSAPAAKACTPRLDPAVPDANAAAAHEAARQVGRSRGELDANEHIALRTKDGYRLRRLTSTILMGVGLFLVGALLGGLLLGFLARRPTLRYARRLDDVIDQQLGALRALAASAEGSAERVLARLEKPLLVAERRAERLLDLAAPLEEQPESDLARTQLEALYTKLETLADAVERLHLRATGWRDRLGGAIDEAAEAEANAHVDAFTATLEGLT